MIAGSDWALPIPGSAAPTMPVLPDQTSVPGIVWGAEAKPPGKMSKTGGFAV
jgi:hypothetical protein